MNHAEEEPSHAPEKRKCANDISEIAMKKKASQARPAEKEAVPKDELLSTEYVFLNGLRIVKPYYYTFTVHAKLRWYGQSLLQVLTSEFTGYNEAYYTTAIKSGRVTLNGQVVSPETLMKAHDLIEHRVHRHEPPVAETKFHLIHNTSNMVVVSKPASVPVHPSGRYRRNTALFILAKEHNFPNLHPVHRLDRLTSGLLLLARDSETARSISLQIAQHTVQKRYLARVRGHFAHERLEVDQPIVEVDKHKGVCEVGPRGKPASTVFVRRHFNGVSTLVETGRTHQIRVHLKWLGHPIVNDPLYNPDAFREVARKEPTPSAADHDPLCPDCVNPFADPEETCIWLHAFSYKGEDFHYETPELPGWACDSFRDAEQPV